MEVNDNTGPRRPGRPRNKRVFYLPEHPRATEILRIIRSPGHNTLPNIIGHDSGFPSRDEPSTSSFYAASILTLLKPWRHPHDLKSSEETWEDALQTFLQTCSEKERDIISNLQHFHSCRQMDAENVEELDPSDDCPQISAYDDADSDSELGEDITVPDVLNCTPPTDDNIENARLQKTVPREYRYASHAVASGRIAGVFDAVRSSELAQSVTTATGGQLVRLGNWLDALKVNAANLFNPNQVPEYQPNQTELADVIRLNQDHDSSTVLPVRTSELAESSIAALDPSCLLPDQRRAYDIITWHLEQTLAGERVWLTCVL